MAGRSCKEHPPYTWVDSFSGQVMYLVRHHLHNIGDSLLEQPGPSSGLIIGSIQIDPSDPYNLFSHTVITIANMAFLVGTTLTYFRNQIWTFLVGQS